MATAVKPDWVRFGTFEANLAGGELYRDGHRVALQQKPFELLRILVSRPGELVSREELRKQLWASDVFVDFEAGLNAAIKRLRRALDDEADNPRFIATLPRRGYRFIAPVERIVSTPADAGPRLRALLGAGAGLAVLLLGLGYILRPALPAPELTDAVAITPPGSIPPDQILVTDGPSVFFTEIAAGGARQIVRVPTEGGVPIPVELPFPAGTADILDVSPEGSELLLRVRAGDRMPLWEVPTQGGAPRRLGGLESPDAAWLPGGAGLTYADGHALYTADAGGGHARRLLELSGEPYYARWSPDQRHLRFTSYDRSRVQNQLWDFDARTGKVSATLAGPANGSQPWGGEWSQDGSYFVYELPAQTGVIWARRERGALWRRARSNPVRLTSGPLSFAKAIFSRDGSHLFAIGTLDRGELVRYDRDGRQMQPDLAGRSADALDFSRDGRWLVYVAFPERTLWRLDRRGGSLEQLTRGPEHALMPHWSPDSRELVYTKDVAGEPWRVVVMSADGSRAEAVTPADLDAGQSSWSPAGDRLACIYRRWGTNESWRLGILDMQTRRLSAIPGSEGMGNPTWSPDGRFLLARQQGTYSLAIYSFAERRWRAIPSPALNYPVWSADGRAIYFNTLGDTRPGIYRIQVGSGAVPSFSAPQEVVDLRGFLPGGTYGDWSGLAPDGSFLLMRYIGNSAIYRFDWMAPR